MITCRNHADLVWPAIASFVEQDYESKRLVVVDDGSSDNSWDIIREIADVDAPCPLEIFSFEQPQGPSFAKNFAVRLLQGESDAFAFLDADHAYEPGKVSRSVALLEEPHGHPGWVYSDYYTIHYNDDYPYITYLKSFSPEVLTMPQDVNFSNGKISSEIFPPGKFMDVALGNSLVSGSVFATVGYFDESLRADENLDLALRASHKFMILHIPDPLVTVHGKTT